MDYPRPAPHNNVFIHTHRKVAMDGYNRYKYTGTGSIYCNGVSLATATSCNSPMSISQRG